MAEYIWMDGLEGAPEKVGAVGQVHLCPDDTELSDVLFPESKEGSSALYTYYTGRCQKAE